MESIHCIVSLDQSEAAVKHIIRSPSTVRFETFQDYPKEQIEGFQ